MELKKATVKNFRGISEYSFYLEKLNVITGPNMLGKTSLVEAVYWALSGYLLGGSADIQNIKNNRDSRLVVSVELEFDSFTFKREYFEKWTTDSSTGEKKLTGNTTKYYIDGSEYKTEKSALAVLYELLGVASRIRNSKVDAVRTMIDPFYLTEILDSKILRDFIIELVGDVTNQDVFAKVPQCMEIDDLLKRYRYDSWRTNKFIKDQISASKNEIEVLEAQRKGFEDFADVDTSAYDEAVSEIARIDHEIAELKVRSISDKDPTVERLEKEIADIQVRYAESITSDHKVIEEKNRAVNERISVLEEERTLLLSEHSRLSTRKNELSIEASSLDNKYMKICDRMEETQKLINAERENWYRIDSLKFAEQTGATVIERTCPQCGYVLNQADIDASRKAAEERKRDFEEKKEKDLAACEKKGKELKELLENLGYKKKEAAEARNSLMTELSTCTLSLEEVIARGKEKKEQIDREKALLLKEHTSEQTDRLADELSSIRLEYIKAKENASRTNDISDQLKEKEKEKEPFKKTVSSHDLYLSAKEKAESLEMEISKKRRALASYEQKKALCDMFIRTKLEMLDKNVAKVFKDLRFRLIEPNIKEGSYTEVCYPLIRNEERGTYSAYSDGSDSEKILTGIYMIERIKEHLGFEDLPIIFDKVHDLDTAHLSAIQTSSQILGTKVDDTNYKRISVLH